MRLRQNEVNPESWIKTFGVHIKLYWSAQQNRPYCALGFQEYGYYGLVFCKAEGEDADADALYVFEGVGTGDEGGTSGTDIVDE